MIDTKKPVYVVTGPTSGIGRACALELARHGLVVLVGRDEGRLALVRSDVEQRGGTALVVSCDLSDLRSVRRAAAEILALGLNLQGVLNNAGIHKAVPTRSAQGVDLSFATNHLGPFLFSELLAPQLRPGAQLLFVVSAVENPERQPAKTAGFRGGRYVSAEACARGEWKPGGSTRPGFDAYATTKQALLASALAFARRYPQLRCNAIEPGVTPGTGLGRETGASASFVSRTVLPLLVPLFLPVFKFLSTPKRAGRVMRRLLTEPSQATGVYYDEHGQPMRGSALVHDPVFQDRVMAETQALLARLQSL